MERSGSRRGERRDAAPGLLAPCLCGLEADTRKSAVIAGPVMHRHTQHWLTLKLLTPEGCTRESGEREREKLKTEREAETNIEPLTDRVHNVQR